jgi:hypothetical protein
VTFFLFSVSFFCQKRQGKTEERELERLRAGVQKSEPRSVAHCMGRDERVHRSHLPLFFYPRSLPRHPPVLTDTCIFPTRNPLCPPTPYET